MASSHDIKAWPPRHNRASKSRGASKTGPKTRDTGGSKRLLPDHVRNAFLRIVPCALNPLTLREVVVSCKTSETSEDDIYIVPVNTANPTDNPGQKARVLLKTLQETFPVFRDCSPLVIGIDRQLLERLPDVDRKTLRIALGMHTNSLRYLKAMERATHRLDLDGKAGAEVMATHRTHATEILRERYRKNAERRQALREAEALEHQRSEKLRQLVEKFDKNR